MKKFLAASDIVEAYEEIHFPIGLPSLTESKLHSLIRNFGKTEYKSSEIKKMITSI
jgi:hypothetical protein